MLLSAMVTLMGVIEWKLGALKSKLANSLSVNRSTVINAYNELAADTKGNINCQLELPNNLMLLKSSYWACFIIFRNFPLICSGLVLFRDG